ncbi:InlB B-repeat-containing protein, partial [Leucobacter sp. G161]|uniref:InlB B-repeat-containing protein n=1 Tax=Leucobacter sp. G161 TaxID=663704 RepID=UPI0009FAD877
MKQRRFAGFGATVGVLTLVSTLLAPAAAHADGETITELFPRTPVAAYVASELNLAVTDVPTTEQLESITQFALRGSTLESLEELAPLTGLTKIDVRDNKLTTLAGAAAFPALDELVVMSNRITDVSGLAGSGLSEFWGGFNPFESGFEVFAGLSNLKLVEARAARIDDAKFAQIVQAPVLSDLDFNTTESSAEFRNTITSIEPVLQRLTLEAMSFNGNLGLTSIEGISQLTSLRNLGLSSTAVYDFSELVQGAFPVQLAHMENHDVLRIKAGEGTVTYTHPVRDMQLTGIPSRQPVVDSFVPFGGVTSWNPASLELTITWDAAELAKKDELVYTHTLFNSTGTKYLEGIMTLALEHEYSVDFDLAGGTGDFPAQIVVGGDTATQPDTTPTRDGYTFTNWVTEAG